MIEDIKNFQIGINIPRFKIRCEDIIESYKKNFSLCKEYNISYVRIFFVRWGLNPIYNNQHIGMLRTILKMARELDIKIIPVLFHFTDFIDYRDGARKQDYSRQNNPFKKKSLNSFFKDLDEDMITSINEVLKVLDGNVNAIELFNEIDLVPAIISNKVSWLNKFTAYIKEKNHSFFVFTSLADDFQYKKYKKVNCPVDVHFYSYPYYFGFQNIEYYKRKGRFFISGESAKYSDLPYIERKEALSFFLSCLYGSFLNECHISSFSRWGSEILGNEKYLKALQIFNSLFPTLREVVSNKEIQTHSIFKLENIKTKYIQDGNNPVIKKIGSRLSALISYPKLILSEFRAIRKFFLRFVSFWNTDTVFIRQYSNQAQEILYIETGKQRKKILIKKTIFRKIKYENLQTGEIGNESELEINSFENYLFILEK